MHEVCQKRVLGVPCFRRPCLARWLHCSRGGARQGLRAWPEAGKNLPQGRGGIRLLTIGGRRSHPVRTVKGPALINGVVAWRWRQAGGDGWTGPDAGRGVMRSGSGPGKKASPNAGEVSVDRQSGGDEAARCVQSKRTALIRVEPQGLAMATVREERETIPGDGHRPALCGAGPRAVDELTARRGQAVISAGG